MKMDKIHDIYYLKVLFLPDSYRKWLLSKTFCIKCRKSKIFHFTREGVRIFLRSPERGVYNFCYVILSSTNPLLLSYKWPTPNGHQSRVDLTLACPIVFSLANFFSFLPLFLPPDERKPILEDLATSLWL